jgi:hypothetical protein
MISSFASFSLKSRWMGLVARKTWQRRRGASFRACQDASMSPWLQRERLAMMGPSTWRETPWIASRSPGEAAAKPASMTYDAVLRGLDHGALPFLFRGLRLSVGMGTAHTTRVSGE